jgi:hypothetical protein
MAINFQSDRGMARQRHVVERARGSYQRRLRAMACAGLAGLLVSPLLTAAAGAEESKYQKARREHPDLFKLYYDETVMAYCGMLTPESEVGFRLERDALLAVDPLEAEALRALRVASDMAADYAYQDYGLNGQKRWCKTEGIEAYNRFMTRFRAEPPRSGTLGGPGVQNGTETQSE